MTGQRDDAAHVPALEARIAKLERINRSLMDRVERSTDLQGNAFSVFETAIALESKVRERTADLERALDDLAASNAALAHARDAADAALKRAQADEANARAAVAQAQASLHASETDLAKAVIRAPINGIVLKRAVEPGQTVAASLQAPVLFTLAENLTQMELHVNVDEADVGKVAAGQHATFSVDAYPDRTYPARITEVRYGSQTVQGVVTYEALLNADNADLSLRDRKSVV